MMDLHAAKCVLLDLASYAIWRPDEQRPDTLSEECVAEAVELVWQDTFGTPMAWFEKSGMYMPLTPEETQTANRIFGGTDEAPE